MLNWLGKLSKCASSMWMKRPFMLVHWKHSWHAVTKKKCTKENLQLLEGTFVACHFDEQTVTVLSVQVIWKTWYIHVYTPSESKLWMWAVGVHGCDDFRAAAHPPTPEKTKICNLRLVDSLINYRLLQTSSLQPRKPEVWRIKTFSKRSSISILDHLGSTPQRMIRQR